MTRSTYTAVRKVGARFEALHSLPLQVPRASLYRASAKCMFNQARNACYVYHMYLMCLLLT